MKARYLDQTYAENFVSKTIFPNTRKSKIFFEPNELMIGDSAIPSTQNYTHVLKSRINRANQVLAILFSAILFIVLGIISQILLDNYFKSHGNSISSGFEFDDYSFENIDKKINEIYSDKYTYPLDSFNEKNILKEIEKIEVFEKEMSEKIKGYLKRKNRKDISLDEKFEVFLGEFKQCAESIVMEKEILYSLWNDLLQKNFDLNKKIEFVKENQGKSSETNNPNFDEIQRNISEELHLISQDISHEYFDLEIEKKMAENRNLELTLSEKHANLNSLNLNISLHKQDQAFIEVTLASLQKKIAALVREIEVLRLKTKDQIIVSDISAILKQLGHDEILQKNHELAKILTQKILLLQKSFKSHFSEEKKQALIQNQRKFKEILTFIIQLKHNAFKIQKIQTEEKVEFGSVLKIKEKDKDECQIEIEKLHNHKKELEKVIKIEERQIKEIHEEIDKNIYIMVKNMEYMKNSTMEVEVRVKNLKEKAEILRREEKIYKEKNEISRQKKDAETWEKIEMRREFERLENEYEESQRNFVKKIQKFEEELKSCKEKEYDLREIMMKNRNAIEKIRADKQELRGEEEEIYEKILGLKFKSLS